MTTPSATDPTAPGTPHVPPTPSDDAFPALAADGTLVAPPSREQLLYWLHEAGEIEHNLMCTYLYAAFSLKRDDPAWTAEQRAAVGRWHDAIVEVAMQEMGHLALVANLVTALGALPVLTRPPFPAEAGPYPADFVIRLAPFDASTIEHFKFLERASHAALDDDPAFRPRQRYRRAVPPGRLSPGPRDYETVGELYEVLAQALRRVCDADGEAAVFVGDPALQLDHALVPLEGVAPVTDLASAEAAITLIVTQGEGGEDHPDSHFRRFDRIGEELAALTAADPSFEPAWPAAVNPVMNAPLRDTLERVHVDDPRVAPWLDIGNAIYTTALRCLLQAFAEARRPVKSAWLRASFALMHAMVPVARGLAARPAHGGQDRPHAGLSFTPLRSLALLPPDRAPVVVAERLAQLHARASALPLDVVAGEAESAWAGVVDRLAVQVQALRAIDAALAADPAGDGLPAAPTPAAAGIVLAAEPPARTKPALAVLVADAGPATAPVARAVVGGEADPTSVASPHARP